MQVYNNAVLPAKAGIQIQEFHPVFLAPAYAGVTGKLNVYTYCILIPFSCSFLPSCHSRQSVLYCPHNLKHRPARAGRIDFRVR